MNRRAFLRNVGLTGAALAAAREGGAEQLSVDPKSLNFKTKHFVWIINGNGCRKKEFYESEEVSPRIRGLAREGFVYEEDHNETITNHGSSFTEMLTGNPLQSGIPIYPTMPHYIRKAHGDRATNYWYVNGVSYYRQWRFSVKYHTVHKDFGEETRPMMLSSNNIFFEGQNKDPREIVAEQFPDMGTTPEERAQLAEFIEAQLQNQNYLPTIDRPIIPRAPFNHEAVGIELIPKILAAFKPKVMIFQQVGHDTGHGNGGYLRDETGYFEYRKVAEATDAGIGKLIDFVKNDPYFSQNTTILVRPEFGRDDEVNVYGDVHHSEGYYQAHRSASVWWGPDIKQGVSRELVNRMDLCTTIAAMFWAEATYGTGLIRPHLFNEDVDHPALRGVHPGVAGSEGSYFRNRRRAGIGPTRAAVFPTSSKKWSIPISPLEYLRHIRDEASYLTQQATRIEKTEFDSDETAKRAFVRSIEIIGEAAKRVPSDLKHRHPHFDCFKSQPFVVSTQDSPIPAKDRLPIEV